jgi:hypothetical protein
MTSKMTPREPTVEMLDAGYQCLANSLSRGLQSTLNECWQAMHDAAPGGPYKTSERQSYCKHGWDHAALGRDCDRCYIDAIKQDARDRLDALELALREPLDLDALRTQVLGLVFVVRMVVKEMADE